MVGKNIQMIIKLKCITKTGESMLPKTFAEAETFDYTLYVSIYPVGVEVYMVILLVFKNYKAFHPVLNQQFFTHHDTNNMFNNCSNYIKFTAVIVKINNLPKIFPFLE